MTGILHIVLARKPIEGAIADNVLKHGTGALNIDGCRVEYANDADRFWKHPSGRIATGGFNPDYVGSNEKGKDTPTEMNATGRWPANLILDKSDEVQDGFPDVKSCGKRKGEITNTPARSWKNTSNAGIARIDYSDAGLASRFFFNFGEQESDE